MCPEFTEHAIAARCPDAECSTVKKAFQCVDEQNLIFTASIILNRGNADADVQKKKKNKQKFAPHVVCTKTCEILYDLGEICLLCFINLSLRHFICPPSFCQLFFSPQHPLKSGSASAPGLALALSSPLSVTLGLQHYFLS